ncbi:sulfotransferase [Nocardioides nanhaiensis]|uniref:Sulfotransferase n=1 Tax=Nocardioides nanhaiensis TaxID=1476871 RepID=A0ABP8VRU0_9ACTN
MPPSRDRDNRGDELGYVFVVTYGRSGSTLLMGLLNSLPGYLLRGENRDAAYHLFRFHQTLAAEKERTPAQASRMRTHPFFGIADVPLARAEAGSRRMLLETLLRPKPDTRVTGFKEIRWAQPDLPEYVAWLRRVFPGARFVVNTRDHAAVLRSGWWAEDPDAGAKLARIERGILAIAEQLDEAAYRVHYDEWTADPTVLRGLVEWLGETWDEDAARAVLARRHSTSG